MTTETDPISTAEACNFSERWREELTDAELAQFDRDGDAYRSSTALDTDQPGYRERYELTKARANRFGSGGEAEQVYAQHLREFLAFAEFAREAEHCRDCGQQVGGQFAAVVAVGAESQPRMQVFCAECAAQRPLEPLERLAVPLPSAKPGVVGPFNAATVADIWNRRERGETYPAIAEVLRQRGVLPPIAGAKDRTVQARRVQNVVDRLRARRRAGTGSARPQQPSPQPRLSS